MGDLLELSESKPAERHESTVSGAYSDDLWFWDLQQDLTNRGCGCYLVRGSLRHMRRHQGVMEFTVAGPHKHPLFSGLACILLQSQSGGVLRG